jgi:cell division transport system permease protein
MKINTLVRHFREGFKNIGRNGWMTFASVSAVTVTLLLVGIFLVIMMNINNMAVSIEEDVEIRVHIDITSSDEQQQLLRKKIERIQEVDTIKFSSKEKELQSIIESFGEEGEVFESLMIEGENPLNDVYIISTTKPEDTVMVAKKIETYDNVSKVNYGQGTVERLFQVVSISRNIGIGLILGLLFTAMFLISNTIKITIVARRKEIEIMKLVGATNNFIRWPFFLEGLFLGILGSVLPISILVTGYHYLYEEIGPKLEDSFVALLPTFPFTIQLSAILLTIGAFIGVWGSVMSVRKFLRV